jgi:hypothetical protein
MVKLKSKHYQHYKGKVYDLSVKDKHTYNANGLAVHNSGAGSLVCYAIGITQVDPIKHGLLFERFLSRKKACLHEDHWVVTKSGVKQLKDISYSDSLLTHTGKYVKVKGIDKTFGRTDCVELSLNSNDKFVCSQNHKWIVFSTKNCKSLYLNKSIIAPDILVGTKTRKLEALVNTMHKPSLALIEGGLVDIIDYNKTTKAYNLVDVSLEYDHTFWVAAQKEGMYVLSHNSLPDIDCLLSHTLVQTPNGYKEISRLSIGDNVIGLDGKTEKVLAIQNRSSTQEDIVFETFIQINNTIGCLVATSKHRFFTIENQEVFLADLKAGDRLKSNCGNAFVLEKRQLNDTVALTDITTTGTKSFNVVPFDVIRVEEKLVSVHSYPYDDNKT